MFYLRREPSVKAAYDSFARGRSVRGDGTIGWCWRCSAEANFDIRPDQVDSLGKEEVARLLGLEFAPWAGNDGRAQCGHQEEPMAQYLPGLCALKEYDTEPSRDEAAQDAMNCSDDYASLPVFAIYEGEHVGEEPDEGWVLFRPTRLVLVDQCA